MASTMIQKDLFHSTPEFLLKSGPNHVELASNHVKSACFTA
jgi:hypothetical protein